MKLNISHFKAYTHTHTHIYKKYSVQFSHSVASDSLRPHELQHARPPCPSPTPRVHPNSCPLSRWCHPTILYSVVPFSSCLQSFPASGSFPMSQLFTSGGQSIGISASTSVLPTNTQDWSPLGWTGWTSNAEEAEVEQFCEDLQDLLELTPRKCSFHYRGLECKSRQSRNTWSNRQIWPWSKEWSRAKANKSFAKRMHWS